MKKVESEVMTDLAKNTHQTWLKWFVTGFGLLLCSVVVLLASMPYWVDLDRLNQTLADNGVKHLGLPLQVTAVSSRWGIRPGVRLHNLTAGDRAAATEVELTLAWQSLLGVWVLHQVEVTDGQIDLPYWRQWWQNRATVPVNRQSQVLVRQLIFTDIQVDPMGLGTGAVGADIAFGANQQLESAQIRLGSLAVDIKRTGSALSLTARAKRWQATDRLALIGLEASATIKPSSGNFELALRVDQAVSAESGLKVTELVIEASQRENQLEIGLFKGDCFGGQVTGQAKLRQQGQKFRADWQLSGIDLSLLAKALDLAPLAGVVSATGIYQQNLFVSEVAEPGPSAADWLSSGHARVEGLQIGVDGWRFSQLTSSFEINPTGLDLPDMVALGYDGSLVGTVDFNWQNNLKMTGQLVIDHLNLKPLLIDSKLNSVSGSLKGKADFNWQRGNQSAFQALSLTGEFAVADGFFPGVDLGMARELLAKPKGPQKGTAFDQAFSKIRVVDGSTWLTEIEITSEVLAVSGDLQIGVDRGLNGTLQIGGNETTGLIRIPVNIDGSLDSPRLRPTKSSLVGGAIGSVLLGPGLGTAVGVKMGEGLNTLKGKLLGSDQ